MAKSFRFDQSWVFPVSSAELWAAICRTQDFAGWWAWLKELDVDGLVEGASARCVVRGPIPYTLAFEVHVHELIPERLIGTTVSGDLEGPARLEVAAHPKGSTARLAWELDLRDPMLRLASRVARPIMQWGHDWVITTGVRQFRQRALHKA